MSSLLIEGGRRLSGRISVEGNKNAALPLLAACLLTTDECVLTNMPRIGDVEVMAKLLKEVGAEVDGVGTSTLRVRCRSTQREQKASDQRDHPAASEHGSASLCTDLGKR